MDCWYRSVPDVFTLLRLAEVVQSLTLPLYSITLRRFLCHPSLPPEHLPFISLCPWEPPKHPWASQELLCPRDPWEWLDRDTLETRTHLVLTDESVSFLCLYLPFHLHNTERVIHPHRCKSYSAPYYNRIFPLPEMTHPILWIDVDNLRCCSLTTPFLVVKQERFWFINSSRLTVCLW